MTTLEAAEEVPDQGAGVITRSSALLCDLGLLLLAWGLLWTGAKLLDPGVCDEVDAVFLRYAAPCYLLAVSLLHTESPGQRFVGLRILDAKYYPLNPFRVLLRCAIFLLTLPLFFVNLVLIAFTREGRALHDRATDTKVMMDPSASRVRMVLAALFALGVAAVLALGLNLLVRDQIELRAVLPKHPAVSTDPLAALRSALTIETPVTKVKKKEGI